MVYTLIAISALGSLVWRHPLANATQKAAAPLGAAFTFICLVTGSLWGKPMWGTYWVWDARLTSMLIFFLIYLGLLALWRTVARVDKARPSSEIDRSGKGGRNMHALAKFGLSTVLVTLAVLSNVLVTLSALPAPTLKFRGVSRRPSTGRRSWFRSSERRSNILPASSRCRTARRRRELDSASTATTGAPC